MTVASTRTPSSGSATSDPSDPGRPSRPPASPPGAVDGRLAEHDRDQFEIKLDYRIDPTQKRNRYVVDSYFFIPNSLGINAQSYGNERFYSDVQAYIRFKTPRQSLEGLLDQSNAGSPLTRIANALASPESDSRRVVRDITNELRLFGCQLRTVLRDSVTQLQEPRHGLAPLARRGRWQSATTSRASNRIRRLPEGLAKVIERFRSLEASLARHSSGEQLLECFRLVDEYISMLTELQLTRLLSALAELDTDFDTSTLKKLLLAERRHREAIGSVCQLERSSSNEMLVYRMGLLKKFVTSVLFLDVSRGREGVHLTHLAAAAAAGLAMLVATLASIVAHTVYGLNTLPFVLALVISYIAKDRLKELSRVYLSSKLAPWLADYRLTIVDPIREARVGVCRERVRFVRREDLPDSVRTARDAPGEGALEVTSKRETILHYQKQVTIFRQVVEGEQQRQLDINDIIRFGVNSFLSTMADPIKELPYFDETSGDIHTTRCHKVYPLNVVFVLQGLNSTIAPQITLTQVILDKGGIVRLSTRRPENMLLVGDEQQPEGEEEQLTLQRYP